MKIVDDRLRVGSRYERINTCKGGKGSQDNRGLELLHRRASDAQDPDSATFRVLDAVHDTIHPLRHG